MEKNFQAYMLTFSKDGKYCIMAGEYEAVIKIVELKKEQEKK